jgi:hypothetical protein
MRHILTIALFSITSKVMSQELFVYTEPASNMPAKSFGLRLNNSIMREKETGDINYHLMPELMLGLSKKFMIHADAFISNRNGSASAEGGSIYTKYRFLSNDDVHAHFRLAVYGRYSFNNSEIHQTEINLMGHNSGYEAGLIATQLLHKVAISSGLSLIKATDNGNNHKYLYGTLDSRAINHTLSIGKLMLPKAYTGYNQTNVNLMLEILSQLNLGSGKYYTDMAPSIQFIIGSVARIDLGYRQQLGTTLERTAPNGFLVRLEYNLFNAF